MGLGAGGQEEGWEASAVHLFRVQVVGAVTVYTLPTAQREGMCLLESGMPGWKEVDH